MELAVTLFFGAGSLVTARFLDETLGERQVLTILRKPVPMLVSLKSLRVCIFSNDFFSCALPACLLHVNS